MATALETQEYLRKARDSYLTASKLGIPNLIPPRDTDTALVLLKKWCYYTAMLAQLLPIDVISSFDGVAILAFDGQAIQRFD